MQITQLSPKEYFQTFPSPQHIYNSADFIAINAHKVSEVIHLCFADSKPRLGLSIGRRHDGTLLAPFSAPFSGFDFNRRQSALTMLEAAQALRAQFPGLQITLPPTLYSPDMNSRTLLALLSAGATISHSDWNSHIPLTSPYTHLLPKRAKNKLRTALQSPLRLIELNDDPLRAYHTIQLNRQQKGYPLHMSADDVLRTTTGHRPPVKADFFALTDPDGQDVAAAMVYTPQPQIAQVIYWGNHPDADPSQLPMNLIAYHLAAHYQSRAYHTLDIGPSSSQGTLSPGLCEFKDTIGCQITSKPTLSL